MSETASIFALGQTKISIEEGDSYSNPITKLEYLRSNFAALLTTLDEIVARPSTILRGEQEYERIEKYRGEIDPLRISEAFGLFGAIQHSGRFLPSRVPVNRKYHQLDIYEHRVIKHCLVTWSAWLRQISRSIISGSRLSPEVALKWSKRAVKISFQLDQILAQDFFTNVGHLHDFRVNATSIFTTSPHYRRFFDLQRRLNTGIGDKLGDYLDMPISKTYQLYEIWCYFRIISALKLVGYEVKKGKIKKGPDAGGGAGMLVEIEFSDFILSFQRRYDEYWRADDGIGSFSRTMIPDISLRSYNSKPSQESVIVFDAKYRVETALNEAISSAHMYRDAIVSELDDTLSRRVVGSYLLTPSVQNDLSNKWETDAAPQRFFHPSFVDKFKFGVFSLNPRMSLKTLAGTLEKLVAELNLSASTDEQVDNAG